LDEGPQSSARRTGREPRLAGGAGASAEGWPGGAQDGSPEGGTPGTSSRPPDVGRPASREPAGRQRGHSWWPPLASGPGTPDCQAALTAGRTGLTGAEGGTPRGGRLALWGRGGWRGGGVVACQPERQRVPQAPMDRGATAHSRGRCGTLGATHAVESAACTRAKATSGFANAGPGRLGSESTPGHDRWSADGGGQRAAVDIAAQVVPDLLRALHHRFAGDDSPLGPDPRGQDQLRACLAYQSEQQAAKLRREGLDGDEGGRARRTAAARPHPRAAGRPPPLAEPCPHAVRGRP
jgi:hypothetical protein